MTHDLEARLLASIPSIGHFQRLEDLGIGEQNFEHYGPMYRYISQVIGDHNHLPRLVDLKATFNIPPHIQRKPEEFDWLLEEFLQLTTVQRIQEILDHDVEIHGEKPRELLPALIKDLTSLMLPNQRSASVTDQNALKRFENYEQLRSNEFIMGIPTGIRYFDVESQLGWLPGELVGIVGRLYIGKSWMLIYHGAIAWMAGKRVLMLSPEMPDEEAEARFDATVCGLYGVTVNVQDLYKGFKPTKEQIEIARKISESGRWITMSSAEGRPFTLGEIPRLVRQFSPDLVLIDGIMPLLGGQSRGQPWEKILELSYGLKNLAVETGTVLLTTHQANRSAHNTAKPPGLHEIYGGDAYAQACDRLLVLSKPTKSSDELTITIQKFRKGQPLHGGTDFLFRPGEGKVKELDEDTRSIGSNGYSGEGLQARAGDDDLMPVSIP